MPVNVSDLRVGNYILYKGEMTKITFGYFYFFLNQYHVNGVIDKTEHIPLTHEILIKAGFKDDNGIFFYTDFRCYFKNIEDEQVLSIYFKGKSLCYQTYLHELQNLIFSLCHSELEIQL